MFPSIIDILILPHAASKSLSSRESRWTRDACPLIFLSSFFLSLEPYSRSFVIQASSQRFSFHGLIPYVSRKPKLDSTASGGAQLSSLWIASNWTRASRLTRERGRRSKFNIGQMERRKVLETMGKGDGKGNVVAFVTRCIRCCPMGGGGRR